MIFYCGNDFVDSSSATVNIMSPSVQYGLNVFEGIKGYFNASANTLNIIELKNHILRLLESAKFLDLRHSYNYDTISSIILETIQKNSIKSDIYIRVVLLYEQSGSWSTNESASLLVAPMISKSFDEFKPGLTTKISSWERINGRSLPPRIKAGANYLNSRLAQLEVSRSGFDMAIFLNSAGFVSEAPGSCIFLVRGGDFYTPTLSSSILGSITRNIVINIIRNELGKKCIECDLERVDFYQADEVFLCGTAMEITPVKLLDHISFESSFKSTREIMNFFKKIIMGEIKSSSINLTII